MSDSKPSGYNQEIQQELARTIRLQQINKRLVALHDSLEPDVRCAAASGLSLTQWRARYRLERNREMKQEVSIEWTRVLTRNITSPVQQQRRLLLDNHLAKVTSQRRRVITDSMETILQGEYGPPLDYSFRNISSLSSLPTKYPRQSLRKQRRSPSGRYNSNVIRLSNNNLVDTHGLYQLALDLVECPENIAWLDLSFNDIEEVTDDILEFPNLKMIYLHGNKISSLQDLAKLKCLPNLYSVTLHGNPLENAPEYRSSILTMLPFLKSLDFAKVTDRERGKQNDNPRPRRKKKKKHSL